LIQEQ